MYFVFDLFKEFLFPTLFRSLLTSRHLLLLCSSSLLEVLMSEEKSQPLPKFGEWDVNDPASADGFTVIFNKARDEKKTGGNIRRTDSPGKEEEALKPGTSAYKPPKKWFCCVHTSAK